MKRAAMMAMALVPCAATAADPAAGFPSKPVRVVIAQLPGGTADAVTRLYADRMGEALGQRFVVDNRAGGGAASVTALQIVAEANPDGHTILVVVPNFTFSPSLIKNMPVDPGKDFDPITLMSRDPYLLTAYPGLPAKNVQEVIQLAKAKPGFLNAGSGNLGSGTHLVTMYFLSAAGIRPQSTYVSYKGSTAAFVDLMAGRLHLSVTSIVTAWPFVNAGKLRALGVTSLQRSGGMPDVPTIAEQGIPGFEATAWYGLVAPARTPPAVIAKLHGAASQAARSPEIREKLKGMGSEAVANTPAEFRQMIQREIPIWRKLIQEIGLTLGQ